MSIRDTKIQISQILRLRKDPFNWILEKKLKKGWRSIGFYPRLQDAANRLLEEETACTEDIKKLGYTIIEAVERIEKALKELE